MKADLAAQQALLEVQQVDTELDRNQHRVVNLPERDAVTSLTAALAELRDELVLARTRAEDLDRSVRRAEHEVQTVRDRAERDRALLESGTISSGKHLTDLEHEIASLARRQQELEDAELEIMEALETATVEQRTLAERIHTTEEELARATEAQDSRLDELGEQSGALQAKRKALVDGLPTDLVAAYDRLRSEGTAVAAAQVRAGRCEACQMELARVDLAELRALPSEEVARCPECRAILVRAGEIG